MTRSPRHDPGRPSAVGLRTALSVTLAALVIAAAAALGALVVDLGTNRSPDVEAPTPTPAPSMPTVDVAGEDPPRLARYPGAVRIAYVRERQGATTVTGIEYIADADIDQVRAHYRRIFREEGWELVEVAFERGDWVFLVERGRRVALVEIESRDPLVGIEVELEQPVAPVATTSPTPTPTPRPPPPPPPPDDDD
jgi:hypothetical protein